MNPRFIDNLEAAGKLAAAHAAGIAYRTAQHLATSTNVRLREQIMGIVTSSIADGVTDALTEAGCAEAIERCQAAAAEAFAAEFERLKSGGAK